jgi:putative membrane protein
MPTVETQAAASGWRSRRSAAKNVAPARTIATMREASRRIGPGRKRLTLTVRIALIGVVLSAVSAWAQDFSAELDFVTRASNSNLFAIEESRLALNRASDPQVKTFARRAIEDHGKAEAELQTQAKGSGAVVPTKLDHDHQARLTALRGKSGAEFDKAYGADQGENHSNALTLYADYMLCGGNEKLHALAIKMIPITEAQLKDAQALPGY